MTCTEDFHIRSARSRRRDGTTIGGEPCLLCDLPLGLPCEPEADAAITPAVMIEIRAAELAAGYRMIGGLRRPVSSIEVRGWSEYSDWLKPEHVDEWLAGWLGHVIYAHVDVPVMPLESPHGANSTANGISGGF